MATRIWVFFHVVQQLAHQIVAADGFTVASTDDGVSLFVENIVAVLVSDCPLFPPVIDLLIFFPSVFSDQLVENHEVITGGLIDPQKLCDRILPGNSAQGQKWTFAISDINRDCYSIDWEGVRWNSCSVRFNPYGSGIFVQRSIFLDVSADELKSTICFFSCWKFWVKQTERIWMRASVNCY